MTTEIWTNYEAYLHALNRLGAWHAQKDISRLHGAQSVEMTITPGVETFVRMKEKLQAGRARSAESHENLVREVQEGKHPGAIVAFGEIIHPDFPTPDYSHVNYLLSQSKR